jgi:hypothetical protein
MNKPGIEITGLNNIAREIHARNRDKGFYDKPQDTGRMLMLVVSELSEALEADRDGKRRDIRRQED